MKMSETVEERLKTVRLVQRMEWRPPSEGSSRKKGVDAYFGMEYMGAAEFEWGALSKTLRYMRSHIGEVKEPREIRVGEHVVWYVGRDAQFDLASAFFEGELKAGSRYLKEMTCIRRVFVDPPKNYTVRTTGWWHVTEDPDAHHWRKSGCEAGWALFRTKEQADRWLAQLRAG
jgi:hypothetical protein